MFSSRFISKYFISICKSGFNFSAGSTVIRKVCTDNSSDDENKNKIKQQLIDNNTNNTNNTNDHNYSYNIFKGIDSFLGYGINTLSDSVDFTSKTLNSTVKKTGKFSSDAIKSSSDLIQHISPPLLEKETKIIPDNIENIIKQTSSTTSTTSKYVKDTIGTITGVGVILGESAVKMIPFSRVSNNKTSKPSSETLSALGNLIKTTAGAVKETTETFDKTTSDLTNDTINASESVSSYLFGIQAGNIVGSSLRTTKDLSDTIKASNLNVKKISSKITKKAKEGALKEIAQVKEQAKDAMDPLPKE